MMSEIQVKGSLEVSLNVSEAQIKDGAKEPSNMSEIQVKSLTKVHVPNMSRVVRYPRYSSQRSHKGVFKYICGWIHLPHMRITLEFCPLELFYNCF